MNRILRAFGALALLLMLVIGVPLMLIALAGWPLPSKTPDIGNIATMVRQNNVQAAFVVKSIAFVVWLAWAQVAAAVVWEVAVNVPRLVSGKRQRPTPLVVAPVSNGVAKLFAMMLTAGLLSSVVSQPAIALTNSSINLSPGTSSLSLESSRVASPVTAATADTAPEIRLASLWVAQGADSLWDIAEQALGDGSEVSLILQLNPDLDASQTLPNGTEIRLPAGSHVPASRARVASAQATASEAPVAEVAATADDKHYTVQANDGMWNVAEALLGDGSRHAELSELVVGQEVTPGVVFTADTFVIHEGWVFTLPSQPGDIDTTVTQTPGAADAHIVVAGDTLSEIAETHLGDADAWPAVFEQNAGRDMGDGRTFSDPNLIVPGWSIDLPGADTPDISDDPTVEAPVAEAPAFPEEPAAPEAAHPDAQLTDFAVPAVEAPPAVPAPPSTTPTTSEAPALAPNESSAGRPDAEENSTSPSPIRIEHAALLAAGVLALVGVRRRQRLRRATPRARVPEPPASVVATERRLRTIDAGERSMRVDVAIRAAAHQLVDTRAQVGMVLVDQDGAIAMRLTSHADLESPWVADGQDRQWWHLPAAVPIELLGESARRVGTPCVALVQLGLADGCDVLVDVEACGTLAVEASTGRAVEVVTALAAGLATSPYAEIAHLITVSLTDAAVIGHRNAHHAPTAANAFELAASLIGSTASSDRSTFSLRSLRTGGEMWEPAIVLLGPSDGERSDAAFELPVCGRGVGLVATARPGEYAGASTRLIGNVDGWHLDAFGTSIDVVPVGIDEADLAAVAELVEDASAPLVIDHEITWSDDTPVRAIVTDDAGDEIVDLSGASENADATETSEPAETLVVFEPRDHRILVRLMGGVDVISHDAQPGVFERSKTVELIAWLATHRASSTRGAARTALWELDVRDATFANVVSEARRALARLVTPPGDDEWVGRTLSDQLPLHDGVVTDADLVAERLAAARLQPPMQAIETLRPAAEMIRAMPFAGTSYLWPDAEGITSNLVLLATGVSTELAGHALSLGDIDLVFWATGQGLKVLPGHEELIGLRMQAHARAGDLAGVRQEWESYERVIVADAWSDGEPAPKLLDLRHQLLTTPT